MLLSMQDSAEASYKVGHPIRVFIHGGCVSRDSVEFAEPETYRLIRYIARHSLLSAGSDATVNIPALEIPSNFQRRMAEFDVRGNLVGELRRIRHCDIVLWDLVVERSGVYEFGDGSVVTNSAELRKANRHQQFFKSARHIPFGSDEHFARWAGSAAMYSNIVQELGLQERFLVLAPDWAEKTSAVRTQDEQPVYQLQTLMIFTSATISASRPSGSRCSAFTTQSQIRTTNGEVLPFTMKRGCIHKLITRLFRC